MAYRIIFLTIALALVCIAGYEIQTLGASRAEERCPDIIFAGEGNAAGPCSYSNGATWRQMQYEAIARTNPRAYLKKALQAGDQRFIGVYGVAVMFPGLDQPTVLEKGWGYKIIAGTSDFWRDKIDIQLNEAALKFAETYNTELCKVVPGCREANERAGTRVIHHTHTGPVFSLVFSNDGKRLASGDGEIEVWDVASTRLVQVINEDVYSLSFSPDGKALASGGCERLANTNVRCELGVIKIWSVPTDRRLRVMRAHTDEVSALAFGPDGKRLASAGAWNDKNIKIWDVGTGRALTTLKGHKGIINKLAYSRDDTRLASGSSDGSVKLWDMAAYRLLNTLIPPGLSMDSRNQHSKSSSGWIFSLAFRGDGRQLATGSNLSQIDLWDTLNGAHLTRLTMPGTVGMLRYSEDGQKLAAGSWDGSVIIWDVSTGRQLSFAQGKQIGATSMDINPQLTRCAVSDAWNDVHLWTAAGKPLHTF